MFNLISTRLLKHIPGDQPYQWLRDAEKGCDIFFWQDEDGNALRFQIWNEEHLWEWNVKKGWKFGLQYPQSGAFSHYQSPTYRYARKKYLQPLDEIKKSIHESLSNQTLQPFLTVVLREIEELLQSD